MDELITGFFRLDVHAQPSAIAWAQAGRAAPGFIGTVGVKLSELTRALGKLRAPDSLLIVYQAGPCGFSLARDLAYRC